MNKFRKGQTVRYVGKDPRYAHIEGVVAVVSGYETRYGLYCIYLTPVTLPDEKTLTPYQAHDMRFSEDELAPYYPKRPKQRRTSLEGIYLRQIAKLQDSARRRKEQVRGFYEERTELNQHIAKALGHKPESLGQGVIELCALVESYKPKPEMAWRPVRVGDVLEAGETVRYGEQSPLWVRGRERTIEVRTEIDSLGGSDVFFTNQRWGSSASLEVLRPVEAEPLTLDGTADGWRDIQEGDDIPAGTEVRYKETGEVERATMSHWIHNVDGFIFANDKRVKVAKYQIRDVTNAKKAA